VHQTPDLTPDKAERLRDIVTTPVILGQTTPTVRCGAELDTVMSPPTAIGTLSPDPQPH
jgi:hypothetical protein